MSDLQVGDRVRIRAQFFDGWTGVVVEPIWASDAARFPIWVQFEDKSGPAGFEAHEVEVTA